MSIDVSLFPKVGKFLFDTAVSLYEGLEFNFGSFTLNGWWFLIGIAIFYIIVWLIGRISE